MTKFLALLGKIGLMLARQKDGSTGYSYLEGDDLTFKNFPYRLQNGELCRLYILNEIWYYLKPVLYAIMAIVGAAGAIYAIYLGVQLARAEDQSKRDEAKKRLITTLIAVAITIALALFFAFLLPTILDEFLPVEEAI